MRNYVNPKDLKASELKALVALLKHGKAPYTDGLVWTRTLVFRLSVCLKLVRLGLVQEVRGQDMALSNAGRGIARIFEKRHILGYD